VGSGLFSGPGAYPEKRPRPGWFFLAGLALLALAGTAAVLTASRLGAGLSDDSYFYIQPARSWLAGDGMQLSPYFAPLLPLALIPPAPLGLDPQVSLGWLNALLFGAVIALTGLAALRVSRSPVAAIAAAFLVLTAENLLNVFPWAMSEPLYIALMLAAVLALDLSLKNANRGMFWLAAALTALAVLTRYMGVMLVGAGALVLLLWNNRPLAKRFKNALVYSTLSLLPVAFYILNNWRTTGTFFGPRGYAVGEYDPGFTRGALATLLNWFIPGRFVKGSEYWLTALAAALLILAALWYRRARARIEPSARAGHHLSPLAWILAAFITLNILLLFSLLFSRGIIGSGEAYSNRYLAPVYVAALVLLAAGVTSLWRAGLRLMRAGIALAVLILMLINLYRAQDAVRMPSASGMGYASQRWHDSETIRYLNSHPDVPVVSTANYGIYFWTGRLPRSISDFANANALRIYLREVDGWLVVIDSMPPGMYGWDAENLLEGMQLVRQFSEGSVFKVDD